MDLSQYAELFATESREQLAACNRLLLEWESNPQSAEPVAGLFRAIHTLKGMAATMGYARVAELAHCAENLLDALRQGTHVPDQSTIDLLFQSADRLEQVIEAAVQGSESSAPVADLTAALDAEAQRYGESGGRPSRPVLQSEVLLEDQGGVRVRVALRTDTALKGARAILVLQRAERLGRVHSADPAPVSFETDTFDGRFAFNLISAHAPADIVVQLKGVGDVDSISIDEEVREEEREAGRATSRARHIRVDLRRLDGLMDLIGELVITNGRLALITAQREEPDLTEVQVQLSRLTQALQSEIVQARMTPVWQVFDRFPRLVRDVARQLGKQVQFRIEGKEIELDRTILDEIGDPLVHLLRNAVDHGIEPPKVRRGRGKPAEGTLMLAAIRERHTVAIRIQDDGRGIDRATVLKKGHEAGLVDRQVESLSDDMLLRVLARPGFSTAHEVSQVSGRGVGIDAVLNGVRSLGGTLELQTEQGRGTAFTIRLPLTLAIVRALLIRIGDERYVVPLSHVAEILEFERQTVTTVEGREALVIGDRVVPLVHLQQLLGQSSEHDNGGPSKRPVIVLERGEQRTGLVVDAIAGQQEIVVKQFMSPAGMLPVFAGATILGDGVPALILDAGGLL